MVKIITAAGLLAVGALALFAGGCGPSTELTGTPIPNALPQTSVTGRPPELTEAGFIVQFYWSGFDADGRIEKYQWKISNNGNNGVSVQDTLTFCPVTGDTLNPWFETAITDSVFFVSADIPGFDPEGRNRSYQAHTFWVRAVDDKGGVDPTPAHVSFTSVTLLPTVRLDGPAVVVGQETAERLPRSVRFQFVGNDPDYVAGLPTKYRYLWKRAIRANGQYCQTRDAYEAEYEFLASFADSAWSQWRPYPRDEEARRVTLTNQPQFDENGNNIFYLFAVQVQDTAGAVSIDRTYGQQVGNVRISSTLAPQLTLVESFLGGFRGGGPNLRRTFDIAAGQPLNFSWSGDASDYAGEIVSYRYGWNVTDVEDPNDEGWELPEGNTSQHRRAPQTTFQSGVHTLTVQVTDNSSQVSRWAITLNVVPVPDPENQLPMLWVDDVFDQNSQGWPSAPPNESPVPLDNDEFRDTFWLAALSGPGGVAGWNPDLHTIDSEDDQITYRDAVEFRNLVWSVRYVGGANSAVSGQFRPVGSDYQDDGDLYNWLVPYQAGVGNLLLAGSRSLNSFLADARYELPIVFESRESAADRFGYLDVNGIVVRRAFGEREMPDGSIIEVGPTRYPFAVMGISVLDIMSPNATYYEYNNGLRVANRRLSACVGLKAVVLDPDFKNSYMPGGDVFADTIYADPLIGWRDEQNQADPYLLTRQYPWGADEFYNADIIARGTPFTIQQCDGADCVEPMFRSIARYNWVRDMRLAADPDDPWPLGYFDGQGQPTLVSICGTRALTIDRTSALTHDRIVGFVARKTAPNKPSQVGDVMLGFDPYRFDNEQMTGVIRWVLDEHFGLTMNP